MQRKKYTEEQISFAFRQAEQGTSVAEICQKMGIAEPTFYRCQKKDSAMSVPELRRLMQLED